jgi:subtilisin family serine protease
VYLRGHADAIIAFVRKEGGVVKGVVNGNIVSCTLPVAAFAKCNYVPEIAFVEYSTSRPHVLGDVMLMNNNILPVHSGLGSLPEAYRGQDVIMGIIDTGIELAHPDFQHPDGTTRVIALWDQTQPETFPFRVPQPYGYGQEWNAEEINAGISGHNDPAQFSGHGSTVTGAAAGNANATGDYIGVAPESDLVIVATNFNHPNWKMSVAEAVEWIFNKAAAIGKPAVINASLGDYFGSHDALDAPALAINNMLEAAPGRVLVCAAGNSDQFVPYHLGYDIPATDTAFTWFSFNPNSALGFGAVFFELWADVANFQNAHFTIGADLSVPTWQFRGYAGWRTAQSNLNQVVRDTIFFNSAIIAIVDTWCGQRGDQYQIQVVVTQPFSNQYRWRFATTGGGRFDCWSHGPFGTSVIQSTNLPTLAQFADMAKYRMPDKLMTIVDSWACSDKVLTVGNYVNRNNFLNYWGVVHTYNLTPGAISPNCSRGPNRLFGQKPDVAASGDVMLAAGRLGTIANMITNNAPSLAHTGMHYSNGGTSMSSPVVAGIAALYLQRCKQASWSHVKAALESTAIADPFTGALPGLQFGHGKVDAFGTLLTSVEPIAPNWPENLLLCEGEVAQISAAAGYTEYTWSNGINGPELVVSEPGIYALTARDSRGCLQQSPSIEVIVDQSPAAPVIEQQGETLVALGNAAAWQWLLNGNPIDGATSQTFAPQQAGVYVVIAFSASGCSATSGAFDYALSLAPPQWGSTPVLYPNPTAGTSFRLAGLNAQARVLLFDISGRAIYPGAVQWQQGEAEVLLPPIATGVYVVQVQASDGSLERLKLAVEK